MNSNFSHALDTLSARFPALKKPSKWVLLIAALLVLVCISVLALRPAALTDLGEGHNARKADLYSQWDKGELVVLMRHVERCDHSTNPCLGQPDGITIKGQGMATQLGKAFQALGMNQVDLYNSPMLRTAQTASYAFNGKTNDQEWLKSCHKSLLSDVVQHKQDHRNLVLVTHSECVAALEKSLAVPSPSSPDYGTSLIIAINPDNHKVHVLGYLDPQDWTRVLARRP